MEGEGQGAAVQAARGAESRGARGRAGSLVRGGSGSVSHDQEFEFPLPPGTAGAMPVAGHAGGRRWGVGESAPGDIPPSLARGPAAGRRRGVPGAPEGPGREAVYPQYAPGVQEIVPEDAGVLDRRGAGAVARLVPDGGRRGLPLGVPGHGRRHGCARGVPGRLAQPPARPCAGCRGPRTGGGGGAGGPGLCPPACGSTLGEALGAPRCTGAQSAGHVPPGSATGRIGRGRNFLRRLLVPELAVAMASSER